jgi:hypothetical protein
VVWRAGRNQQRNRLREVSQPLTSRRDSRLRCGGQRARNARAQGRLQGVVRVKDGPAKNRCNYDSSGLRLLAVAKYEGLPPWGYPLGSQLGGAGIMSYIRRRSHTGSVSENARVRGRVQRDVDFW